MNASNDPTPNLDYIVNQGATWIEKLTWLDADENPIDLTGFNAKLQIRQKPDAKVVLELSDTNGRITITPLAGELDLLVDATVTAQLIPDVYRYDLLLINGAEVTRLLEGNFKIKDRITQ